MKRFPQGRGWLVVVSAAALIVSSADATSAQDATNRPPARAALVPPPMPVAPSPVDYFRKLLAMSPEELQGALANKPPKIRQRILAKVNEYAAMDSDDRELRLRATELRWYLMPLLEVPPAQRSARLAMVPEDIRDIVQSRLMEWEILPPTLQQEFLDNEHIAGYFAGVTSTTSGDGPAPSGAEESRWNGYSDSQRQAMISQFNAFFELSPMEKQKALGELTGVERTQMAKTLQTFGKLPVPQRVECIRAFGKFATMSPEERAEFLKNAQRWSKMTPGERQAWRDLVAHVPQWPPLPPAIMPPPPMPPMPHHLHAVADTNHG